jgi:response regulator RpfG family c-di-GMP phosphodiesterase
MQKILLITDKSDADLDIRRAIEHSLPYHIMSCNDMSGAKILLESKVFNLAIIDMAEIDAHVLHFVEWLKNSSYTFPILVVANKVQAQPQVQSRLMHYHDMHLLVKPTTEKNVLGLVRKLLVAKKVPKQLYRRFNTNQIAQMEALASGDSLLTSMYNLSKGGVYCEFDGATPVTVGDMFRMKIFLSDTNSEYTFNAKVIWTTSKGRFSGRFGCGFKFVSAKDTYRSLLSKT